MSISSSSSPERYCLGGLMKDLDKDLSPREYDFDSKEETLCKTNSEQKLSLDSFYSFKSKKDLFSPSLESNISIENESIKKDNIMQFSINFSIKSMLSAFNNQKSTIFLQKSLMEASKDEIDNIVKEMKGYYRSIIKNKNGNYFCKDLIKLCDKNQRVKILEEISNNISEDCIDEFGVHPIQTLIELAKSEEEYKLLLTPFNDYNKLLKAALNQNGSFVIQKIIVHIPEKYRMEFNLIFVKYICTLSMDIYGVCTVIKFINYTKNENIEKLILNLLTSNFVYISENQYGNYFVQNIMERWWNSKNGLILKKVCIDKFVILANNHYSSYVCDMLLKLSNIEDKSKLMKNLIKSNDINSLYNTNSGKIIANKLMNGLKKDKKNFKSSNRNLWEKNNNKENLNLEIEKGNEKKEI